MNVRKALGANIKSIREHKGWSQEELAERSGIHRTYISGLERSIRNPTLSVIETVAEALGVSASDLIAKREYK